MQNFHIFNKFISQRERKKQPKLNMDFPPKDLLELT